MVIPGPIFNEIAKDVTYQLMKEAQYFYWNKKIYMIS